jgi:microcystin-dependent protein
MHPGQGPGLSLHDLGEVGGSETVTLLESEIPGHSHSMMASKADAIDTNVNNELFAKGIGIGFYAPAASLVQLADTALTPAGGDQPHNNMMPYLTLNFCIALQGVFPPRT